MLFFFFQAEDGIRDAQESRGLGDVYKRQVFSHTAYTFPSLVAVCEKVAREAVIREGGFIEKDGDGKETLVIPVRPPRPGALMQSWEPGPPENCRYSQEELSEIVARE